MARCSSADEAMLYTDFLQTRSFPDEDPPLETCRSCRSRPTQIVKVLLRQLKSDPDSTVRQTALDTLPVVQPVSAPCTKSVCKQRGKNIGAATVRRACECGIRDTHPKLRMHALRCLFNLETGLYGCTKRATAKTGRDRESRSRVDELKTECLVPDEGPPPTPGPPPTKHDVLEAALVQGMCDGDPRVRRNAIDIVVEMISRKQEIGGSVERMLGGLGRNDADEAVRNEAVHAEVFFYAELGKQINGS